MCRSLTDFNDELTRPFKRVLFAVLKRREKRSQKVGYCYQVNTPTTIEPLTPSITLLLIIRCVPIDSAGKPLQYISPSSLTK